MRIQESIFVIIVTASTLTIRLSVRGFTDKFRWPINRFFQVAIYFLLLILTVDLYYLWDFALVLRSDYYHKLTLSLGQPCQNTIFLKCAFPFCNISFLFVLLIAVFLTLKSNSYRSTKHFHTLSFLVTIRRCGHYHGCKVFQFY